MDAEGPGRSRCGAWRASSGSRRRALYWHFAGKDELCREVVRTVGEQLEVSGTTRALPDDGWSTTSPRSARHWRAHPGVLELCAPVPAVGGGRGGAPRAVTGRGARGRHADDALECYRALSWTVTGFVILEQTLDQSVHHRTSGPTRWVLDLDDGAPPSSFDTDQLFRTTLGLALDGLERRVG